MSNARDLKEAHDHPQWGESAQLLRMPRVLRPSWLSEKAHAQCSYTMGRSHTIAHNAIMRLHAHTISEITEPKEKVIANDVDCSNGSVTLENILFE